MSAIERDRLALVRVKAGRKYRYGTGYLVADNLVLTARHVWTGQNDEPQAEVTEVWFLETREWCLVKNIVDSKNIDACLLQVIRKSVSAKVQPLFFGKYDRSQVERRLPAAAAKAQG